MKEDRCIYFILANIGSAYFVFLYTFHSSRESLGDAYKIPSLKSYCDYLIREKDELVHLGVINTTGISNKSLVSQYKDKSKHPTKKHPCNKQNKGHKPSHPTYTLNGDKGLK
jgi:hypothetical protein